jgi:hypothetical protein
MVSGAMAEAEFIEQLRRELPRLLRERPEVRHELWGIMLEAFPSRQEFLELLQEMRAFREDTNRRFEELRQDMDRRFEELRQDMDRRFEAVDRRFEAIIEELRDHGQQLYDHGRLLRDLNIQMSALGSRVGYGLEQAVRDVVEEFAGETFPFAERLLLQDESGEVYGVVGADVEFDLYAHNGTAYLVEVKSHLKTNDVLMFHRQVRFAEGKLGRQVTPLIIALSMEPRAERQMRELGIKYRVRSVVG